MHEKKIAQYLPNYKHQKVDHGILESSFRILQVTSKWKTLKNLSIFIDYWILTYFDIQTRVTLGKYFGKGTKLNFLKIPQNSFKTSEHSYQQRLLLPNNAALNKKKMKKLCYFGGSFFKIKIADIYNFQSIKYLGKSLSYLKNGGIVVNYCWNYWPSEWLLHFIKYRLDQLNNKRMKTAVNLTIQLFESRYQRKYLVKVWSILAHSPQNDGPVNFMRNLTETIF